MTPQQRFEHLKTRWRTAYDKARDLRFELIRQYGREFTYHAPKAPRDRLERVYIAEDKAAEAIFAWLELHSPRQWRTGVPAHWVCESLTYADAMTTGQMQVIPPVAYGHMPNDAIRFAAPLETV